MTGQDKRIILAEGYTRQRHWEVVYHDLVDLYGPMIGLDGIGLWLAYKRFLQNDPDHLLTDLAWPSHRGRLAPLFSVGQTALRNARHTLEEAKLVTALSGQELVERAQAEYDQQLLEAYQANSRRSWTLQRITLGDLTAAAGVRNPARTLFIEVHDPLSLHPFCETFGYTYSAQPNGRHRWEMRFDDYGGIIQGPNRLLAAVRYVEDHLVELEEHVIRSLLRCQPGDAETVEVRERLLQRRTEQIQGLEARSDEGSPQDLPADLLEDLEDLGWVGSTAEVEQAYEMDPERVRGWLTFWLSANGVENPAGAFRAALRSGDPAPRTAEEREELDRMRYVEGKYAAYIKH